ncbi:MEDS domain-containing protein [Solirubrobacter sp. CPCC 204708]|uniref:Anti-sigma factor RsbA family regulatory protein n=1 Tax=Solirubrobacter deserti TaxID=2282478 RepID=A0ABT4RT71_9ACTN|nr:anti-sigma factor RsbA family regulatory protein [Solirubrobacter deserti]MBE2318447.1 MEDS domain-containing protein [Solirubrobacter deserti]MDA0141779.1 anti-sigma factor RsbA family regulatory protein [Solirubrobacter deserti]
MPFIHQAVRYAGTGGLLDGVLPHIREGVQRGEPVRVAAREQTLAPLREALGDTPVELVEVDHNPARIIPFWREFVESHRGPVRGVGEPIWPGRNAAELVECQLHESLLNLAFEEDFNLLCPYDAEALDEGVLHEACCSHPIVDGAPSPHYRAEPLPLAPLPPPPSGARVLGFEIETLSEVRQLVRDAGGDPDFVLAVDELAINSVQHGGGRGIVRLWKEDDALVCDVRDQGIIRDPLAGRLRPEVDAFGGRGLWIANAVCKLVQIRPGLVRVRSGPLLPAR